MMTLIKTIQHIDDHIWTPVRTKPRREKKLGEYCESNQIEYYLPLRKQVHRYKRRTIEFFVPMFAGYIFCNLDEESFKQLLLSNSVVYRINLNETEEKQLIKELNNVVLYEELSSQKEVLVKPELVQGAKIKVSEGALKGVEGYIEERKGKTMVTINIELLGQSVSTEIDVGDLDLDE